MNIKAYSLCWYKSRAGILQYMIDLHNSQNIAKKLFANLAYHTGYEILNINLEMYNKIF